MTTRRIRSDSMTRYWDCRPPPLGFGVTSRAGSPAMTIRSPPSGTALWAPTVTATNRALPASVDSARIRVCAELGEFPAISSSHGRTSTGSHRSCSGSRSTDTSGSSERATRSRSASDRPSPACRTDATAPTSIRHSTEDLAPAFW
jgi:hypothetical protein